MGIQEKILTIAFPNGAVFELPARVLAEQVGEYYASIDSGWTPGDEHYSHDARQYEEFKRLRVVETENAYLNNEVLYDWLRNNVDWEDIKDHVKQVKPPAPARTDYAVMFDSEDTAGFEFNWGSPL